MLRENRVSSEQWGFGESKICFAKGRQFYHSCGRPNGDLHIELGLSLLTKRNGLFHEAIVLLLRISSGLRRRRPTDQADGKCAN